MFKNIQLNQSIKLIKSNPRDKSGFSLPAEAIGLGDC